MSRIWIKVCIVFPTVVSVGYISVFSNGNVVLHFLTHPSAALAQEGSSPQNQPLHEPVAAPPAVNPLQSECNRILAEISAAEKLGIGTKAYLGVYKDICLEQEKGEASEKLRLRLKALSVALSEQIERSKVLKSQKPVPAKSREREYKIQSDSKEEQEKYKNIDYKEFMTALEKKIKRCWHPPHSSNSRSAKVLFKVHSDGAMTDLRLTSTSGSSFADEIALKAVREASPFTKLPAGSPESVDIDFSFDLNLTSGGVIKNY